MLMEQCAGAQISSVVEILMQDDCWRSYRIYHVGKIHARGSPHTPLKFSSVFDLMKTTEKLIPEGRRNRS